jgi:hypothetical protein
MVELSPSQMASKNKNTADMASFSKATFSSMHNVSDIPKSSKFSAFILKKVMKGTNVKEVDYGLKAKNLIAKNKSSALKMGLYSKYYRYRTVY